MLSFLHEIWTCNCSNPTSDAICLFSCEDLSSPYCVHIPSAPRSTQSCRSPAQGSWPSRILPCSRWGGQQRVTWSPLLSWGQGSSEGPGDDEACTSGGNPLHCRRSLLSWFASGSCERPWIDALLVSSLPMLSVRHCDRRWRTCTDGLYRPCCRGCSRRLSEGSRSLFAAGQNLHLWSLCGHQGYGR